MSTCVIKHCKNNPRKENNDIGVTFHKFPEDSNWKYKWIEVIRSNRRDDNWLPSKLSVICSLHFEDDDLYITQSGVRHVVKNAIPKKVFVEVSGDDDCIVVCDSSTSSGSSTPISHQVNKEYINVIGENAQSIGNDPGTSMKADVEKNSFCSMTDVESDSNPLGDIRNDTCSPMTDYSSDSNTCDTPLEIKLKYQLKRQSDKVNTNRKIIKLLHKKIRRLDMRNVQLSNKLKELKEQTLSVKMS